MTYSVEISSLLVDHLDDICLLFCFSVITEWVKTILLLLLR